jgi:hypothetical protein
VLVAGVGVGPQQIIDFIAPGQTAGRAGELQRWRRLLPGQ